LYGFGASITGNSEYGINFDLCHASGTVSHICALTNKIKRCKDKHFFGYYIVVEKKIENFFEKNCRFDKNVVFLHLIKNSYAMKKIFIVGFLLNLFLSFAFSQGGVHAREGSFLKRIENNRQSGYYNLSGKGDLEKRFFGDFNSMLEFFIESSRYHDVYGFRIVKKESSHTLEVKYISNIEEVEKKFEDKLKTARASRDFEEIRKIRDEKIKSYRIGTRTVPITNDFSEKLYEKFVSLIDNFRGTEMDHPDLVPVTRGGEPTTFRVVVKAELWSLYAPVTQDDAKRMANLCKQIITDVIARKFDENMYINSLDYF